MQRRSDLESEDDHRRAGQRSGAADDRVEEVLHRQEDGETGRVEGVPPVGGDDAKVGSYTGSPCT